jgi:hypothetical protein
MGLKVNLGTPRELKVPRTFLARLLAARTGHGDYADYHERFGHDDAEIICTCERRKHPVHIFYCRKVWPTVRPRLGPVLGETFMKTMGPKHFKDYVKLVDNPDFFGSICSRGELATLESPSFNS